MGRCAHSLGLSIRGGGARGNSLIGLFPLAMFKTYLPPATPPQQTPPISLKTPMVRGPRTGYRYRMWRLGVFRLYGHTCHLCGHEGAWDADHVTPLAVKYDNHTDPRTGRPAHGVHKCPTCKIACNQVRGATELETIYEPQLKW